MTPEQWQEVQRLYQAALERRPEERAAFLSDACGSDRTVLEEVESLLAYQPRAENFIETPAGRVDGAAAPLASAVRAIRERSDPERFVGRVFGSYAVAASIGAGGMGEVYRAVDTRLDRTVAIKILTRQHEDRSRLRERFRREAKIVSSLNHRHICALYDIGSDDGIDYLVMEYLEGETLEERLTRGPLPVPEAIEFLTQIADALDKVHRRGIVHRDLKPANVMITKGGVKLLDFGVATVPAPPDDTSARSPALTAEGLIVGTLPYMAPEQIQGKPTDGRTDIFALGCIGYEMLTGRKAFQGDGQAELMSAILRDTPEPIESLLPGVPVALVRTLERCLARDPEERFQTANDLLFHLRSSSIPSQGERATAASGALRWVERALWIAAVAIVGIWYWSRSPKESTPRPAESSVPVRFSISPPEGVSLSGTDVPLALSPDGRYVTYAGTSGDGTRQLWLRSFDSESQRPLPGTEDATTPFWSPDSQWVGFFSGSTLKKVRVPNGPTQVIATDVVTFGGAAWNRDDVIIFPGFRGETARVSAHGGAVSRVAVDEGIQFSPQFLRDGKHFIYAAGQIAALRVGSLDGQPSRTLMTFPVRISTVGYANGHVFFVVDDSLFARPLDEERLEFTGEARRVATGIPMTAPARAPFSLSANGVLAYWPFPLGTPAVLRWFDRQGRGTTVVDVPAQYRGLALSPDGRRLLFSRINRSGASDLWLRDLEGPGELQLTYEGDVFTPQWSPDGARIAYSSPGQRPPPKLFVRNLARSSAPNLVAASPLPNFASSWSPDGRSLISVRTQDPVNRHDLWLQSLSGGSARRLPFNTPFNESHAKVSPDGRWIAYTSDASGKEEVWVADFPDGRERRQVSNGGGKLAQWSGTSGELFYVSEDRQLIARTFKEGEFGPATVLFRIPNLNDVDKLLWPSADVYVPSADGQRFLVAVDAQESESRPINVLVNWPGLLGK